MAANKNNMQNENFFVDLCNYILEALKCFCPCVNNSKDKEECIKYFQDWLYYRLNGYSIDIEKICEMFESGKKPDVTNGDWVKEYKKPNSIVKDRVDIINPKKNWIIEIDTTRADQVAKKAFSRIALYGTGDSPIFYVAIIYPGTKSMNVNEVIKYSRYGYDIVKKMNSNNDFRTIIINCASPTPSIKVIRFDKRIPFTINGYTVKTMSDAIEKAIEIYLDRRGNNFSTLEEALSIFNKNHNGLQTIVSEKPLQKGSIEMIDVHGKTFYVTKQWSYKGHTANFEEICKFFNKYNIKIEPIYKEYSTPLEYEQ